MTDKATTDGILNIIDRAMDTITRTSPPPPQMITCNRGHDTEHLYYRRPFRTSPDTIIACRACDQDNAIDAQQHPEPSDLYEN